MRVFVFAMVALTTITSATELDGTQKDVRSLLRRATSVDIQSVGSVSDGQAEREYPRVDSQGRGVWYMGVLYSDYDAAWKQKRVLDGSGNARPAQVDEHGSGLLPLYPAANERPQHHELVDQRNAGQLAYAKAQQAEEEERLARARRKQEERHEQQRFLDASFVIGSKTLGRGAYGVVAVGHRASLSQHERLAVKTATRGTLDGECAVMAAVGKSRNRACHDHVIQSVGSCPAKALTCVSYDSQGMCSEWIDLQQQAMGMELCDGSIQSFFRQNPGKAMYCRETILRQTRDGLDCLHEAGYVHMDLKDDNIFYKGLDAQGCPARVIVADLGMAKAIGTTIDRRPFKNREYMGSSHNDMSMWAHDARPLIVQPWLDDNGLIGLDLCDIQRHCEPWMAKPRALPAGVTTEFMVQEVGH